MQNIPARTGWGERIREAFVPGGQGQVLLSADYSQVELRVLAHLSGDKALCRAFKNGDDIHAQTARNLFGTQEVSAEMRRQAKVVNFGVIYGMSPYGLAKELDIDHAKAMEYIDQYFRTYPGVRDYLDAVIGEAREKGSVRTAGGRQRTLPDIQGPNRMKREMSERMAVNTPVQGTAAELIKLAMLDLDRKIRSEQWPLAMILQVHDELVFEAPAGEAGGLAEKVRRVMEEAMDLAVPVIVDVKWGKNWREAHP
jgi:DNA polymerase-1